MEVWERIKAEWEPPSSIAKLQSGEVIASFRSALGWKIDEKTSRQLCPDVSASALRRGSDGDDTTHRATCAWWALFFVLEVETLYTVTLSASHRFARTPISFG